MDLVEIDVIELEAAQAVLDLRHDMPARQAPFVGTDLAAGEDLGVEAHFGRDDEVVAAMMLEYAPEDLLGGSVSEISCSEPYNGAR
jgi:hypothetical protein